MSSNDLRRVTLADTADDTGPSEAPSGVDASIAASARDMSGASTAGSVRAVHRPVKGAVLPMGLAALAGIVAAFAMFGADNLLSRSTFWLWPPGDHAAYLVALTYFLQTPWHLPIFGLPMLGYPEGGSVILNDAVPLGALAAKAIYGLTGLAINHLAAWPLIAYPLQGVMAVRLVRALGERSVWMTVALALWPILLYPFLQRFGHVALTNHFLLLWTLALYFEQVSGQRRPAPFEQVALVLTAAFLNPYLWAMVVLLSLATGATLLHERRVGWSDALRAAAAGAVALGLMALAGYFTPTHGALASQEVGVYTWNPLTAIVPSMGPWHDLLPAVSRMGPFQQYEGESYLGMGPVIVLIVSLATRRRQVWSALRRHWVLTLTLALCVLFAASNKLYIGSMLVLDVPLPDPVAKAAGIFRAQGRFVWPALYVAMLGAGVLLLGGPRRRWAAALVLVASVSQVAEAVPMTQWCRSAFAGPWPLLIDAPRLTTVLASHQRLRQYPSWWCGGNNLPADDVARQLQVQVLAARLDLPNNSVYTSRPLKDCAAERIWGEAPVLEEGTLYLFLDSAAAAAAPPIRAAMAHGNGHDFGWATACSRRPLEPGLSAGETRTWFKP